MRWFQNTYTRRFNTRHRLWGHPFGARYKAVLVEGVEFGNGGYLSNLIAERLRMKSAANVSQQLGRKRKPERASVR